MGYWIVMALMVVALVAVVVALAAQDATSVPGRPGATARIDVAALGASGRSPERDEGRQAGWAALIAGAGSDRLMVSDFTRPNVTVEQMRREQLPEALATMPRTAVVWVGTADLLGGSDLAQFERELAEMLTSVCASGCLAAVANTPDLTLLPDIARHYDPTALRDAVTQWNATIARLTSAYDADLVDLTGDSSNQAMAAPLFACGEEGMLLTNEGHRWLADRFRTVLARVTAGADAVGSAPSDRR